MNLSADRGFFERVRRDHQELRELLGTMHRVLAERREDAKQVHEMFASLCDRIEAHFNDEEEGRLFVDIVDRAPRLTDRANALQEEHTRLHADIQQLARHAHEEEGSAEWWQRLEEEFQSFSRELMHHESKEVELVQDAYGEDIGATD